MNSWITKLTHTAPKTPASTPPPSQDASQSKICFAVGTGCQGTPDGPGLLGGGAEGTEGNTDQLSTQDTRNETLVHITGAPAAPAGGAAAAALTWLINFSQNVRNHWNQMSLRQKIVAVTTMSTLIGAFIAAVAAPSALSAEFHPFSSSPCNPNSNDCITPPTQHPSNPTRNTVFLWVQDAFTACLNATGAAQYADDYLNDVINRLMQLQANGNLTEAAAQCLGQLQCPEFFNQTSGPVAIVKAVNASFLSQIGALCTS